MADKTEFELLQDSVEIKRAELEAREKIKITSFIVNVSSSFPDAPYAVAYIKEPHRIAKMKAIDALEHSPTMAGDILLQSSLLPESDQRILNDSPEYDTLYLTMIQYCREMLLFYANVVKKN